MSTTQAPDPAHFARIKAVFAEVCDLVEPEFSARLNTLTEDPAIIAEVRALSGAEPALTARFAQPMQQLLHSLAGEELKIGDLLGRWKLVGEIGHGGMGTVFRAQRSDGHFEQLAAIKVLRGMQSTRAIDYLAQERQILATLAHPNIARLLDGGATPRGQPYLVMEYVEGEPIDAFCRSQALGVADRLRLLVTVCHAVGFAHQRLVVHCDLKPGNVLVSREGRPLLLDFGIARLLGTAAASELADGATPQADEVPAYMTGYAYTPRYASPEQRAGAAISTATDIYSLGLMLIELLLPSGAPTAAGTTERVLDAGKLADPELRAIAQRATALDPSARYTSADALAGDLQRYLRREPVQALAQSGWYGLRKFVQRRWPLVATAALFLLTVTGFTLRLLTDRNRAEQAEQAALRERDHALQAQASARQISDFLVSVFDGSNPDAGSGEIPTSQLVEQALGRIDSELKGQPATQAELYGTLAGVQAVLGNAEAARGNFTRAIDLQRTLDQPLLLADLLMRRAKLSHRSFGRDAAEADAREAVALTGRFAEPESVVQAQAFATLGEILSGAGKHSDDEALLRHALAIQQRIDPHSAAVADLYSMLGARYTATEQYEEALGAFRQAMALRASLSGTDSAPYFNELEAIGSTYGLMRRFAEAESTLRQALAGWRKLGQGDNVETAWRLSQLARIVDNSGRSREAVPLYREALAIGAKKMGVGSVSYAVLLNNLAIASRRIGDYATAEQAYAQALPIMQVAWPKGDLTLERVRNDYGLLLLRAGKPGLAREPLFTAFEGRLAQAGGNDPAVAQSRTNIAEWELASDHADRAAQQLALVAPLLDTLDGLDQAAYERVRGLLEARHGQLDAALSHLQRAEQLTLAKLGEHDPRSALSKLDRAQLLSVQADPTQRAAGRSLAQAIHDAMADALPPGSVLSAQIERLTRIAK